MTDREDLELGRLMVATCATGDDFTIDLATGMMHLKQHEHPVDDVEGSYEKLHLSFDEFLEGFHPPSS